MANLEFLRGFESDGRHADEEQFAFGLDLLIGGLEGLRPEGGEAGQA